MPYLDVQMIRQRGLEHMFFARNMYRHGWVKQFEISRSWTRILGNEPKRLRADSDDDKRSFAELSGEKGDCGSLCCSLCSPVSEVSVG